MAKHTLKTKTIPMAAEIGDIRLKNLLALFSQVKSCREQNIQLVFDWSKTTKISPSGYAVLACLFDTIVEQQCSARMININRKFNSFPIVANLKNAHKYQKLPKPSVHDMNLNAAIIQGGETSVDLSFYQKVEQGCGRFLDEDESFDCRLIINELMQNSIDHSTSERYYLYAGLWNDEFQFGVLDMGVTIPAKLEAVYNKNKDMEYLELALEEGISTRRQRPGGLGLYNFFKILKNFAGKLTIVSRNAYIKRYFNTRKIERNELTNTLDGTWCFARLPMKGKA